MTAKEWLKEEGLDDPKVKVINPVDKDFPGYDCSTLMERYANSKNRDTDREALLFIFRNRLKQSSFSETTEGQEAEYWLKEFDAHFGITNARRG